MHTTLPLYLEWNNLLSFDREQLIFTYVVGGVQSPNISKDELNPSQKVYIYIIECHNYNIIFIQNEVRLRRAPNLRLGRAWWALRGWRGLEKMAFQVSWRSLLRLRITKISFRKAKVPKFFAPAAPKKPRLATPAI